MFSNVSHVGFDYWNFCIGEAKGWTWGPVEEGTLSVEDFIFLVFFCLLFCESQTFVLILICFQCFMMNRSTFHWMLLLVDSSRWGKRGTNFMKQTTRWSLVYKRRWVHFSDYPVSVLFFYWISCFSFDPPVSDGIDVYYLFSICWLAWYFVFFINSGEWPVKIYWLM